MVRLAYVIYIEKWVLINATSKNRAINLLNIAAKV